MIWIMCASGILFVLLYKLPKMEVTKVILAISFACSFLVCIGTVFIDLRDTVVDITYYELSPVDDRAYIVKVGEDSYLYDVYNNVYTTMGKVQIVESPDCEPKITVAKHLTLINDNGYKVYKLLFFKNQEKSNIIDEKFSYIIEIPELSYIREIKSI